MPTAHTTQLEKQVSRLERAEFLMREAEHEAREGDERFRQLADHISEVFFMTDTDFHHAVYLNAAFEKVWGISVEHAFEDPRAVLRAVPAEDRRLLLAHVARARAGEDPGDVAFRIVRPNGEVRRVLGRAVPIRDPSGEVYLISGVVRDVTVQYDAQAALEESATRYRKLTEASFDATDITQDGRIREASDGFVKMFGYAHVDEVIGRPAEDFIAPESREFVMHRVNHNIDGHYEMVGLRKDGRKLMLEVTVRGHIIDGRPARITAVRDVTEKRSLEEQYRQAQKMEAVGQLAGGVAHDFNNLLTVINGLSDILLMDMLPGDSRRGDLEQIRKAGESAAGLTRQLLTFSRQQVVERRAVELETVVAKARKILVHLIGEDIELATSFGRSPCVVNADPGQLEQVIMNLAVNARDAMPTGGKLTLETQVVTLDDETAHQHWPATPGRYALLAVSDNGIGMNEATREHVFEPFFTTKEQGKGTGLGLATVYGIVKQSGGFVGVYSELGVGTTFKVYLPLMDGLKAPDVVTEQPDAARGRETVLLVEDSDAVRDLARRVLERQGYVVIATASAVDALELAGTPGTHIDILLTDVVMPLMSGRVLAERFHTLCPMAKVLYMSGYTDDAIVRHGVLRANMHYLQKPFTPHALASKLREVLDAPAATPAIA
jgi:two-component system, cell cycle sensor histidine kinase and response regulator CckA